MLEQLDGFVATRPFGRVGSPEEVADMVVRLVPDGASFVTGNAPRRGGHVAL